MIKVSAKKYNKIMDKLIEEIKELPVHEQLTKLLEEASKYEIAEMQKVGSTAECE